MHRIIFMGTPDFAVPTLEALIDEEGIEVVAVVTQPDRKVGRKQQLTPPPVKQLAQKEGVFVLQAEHLRGSEAEQKIVDLAPDLIITAAYGQIVSRKVLQATRLGAVNLHGSLLPKYRGAAPIQYALRNGEEVTGITLMYMSEQMDAGDIIAQAKIMIEDDDDAGSLFHKLSLLARDVLLSQLDDLFNQTNQRKPQDEAQVSYAPMIKKEQEQIDWTENARFIHGKVRALSPTPGAYTYLDNERFKIWRASLSPVITKGTPGEIIKVTDDELIVACGGQTSLALEEVQPAGKRRMSVNQYLNGQRLEEGGQFEFR